jgi:hypothetical protein
MFFSKEVELQKNVDCDIEWHPLIICAVSISFLLYNVNSALNGMILLFFAISLLVANKNRCLEFLIIPIIFFDYVLNIEFIGGTFNRVFELYYIFVFLVKKDRDYCVSKKTFFIVLIYGVLNVISAISITNVISVVLNTIVIIICFEKMLSSESGRNIFLYTIAIASLCSFLYGISRGVGISEEYGFRLYGTVPDPNFSAALYSVGIIACICTNLIGKKIKALIIICLLIGLATTVSQSGFLGVALMVMLLCYFLKPSKGVVFCILFTFVIMFFLNYQFKENSYLNTLQNRIVETIDDISVGNYSEATTSRSKLWKQYITEFENEEVVTTLFGGVNPTTYDFRRMHGFQYASHSTYVDTLFYCGIIGSCFIWIYIYTNIYFGIVEYKRERDLSILGITIVKISLAYSCTSLSMFGGKFFDVLMFL